MKKLISILAIFILFLTSVIAQDNDEYNKSLRKMFEVSGSQETFSAVINQLVNMYKQQFPQVDAEIWDEMGKEFLKLSINDLIGMISPVYQKYFTKNDLDQLIKFYESPVGKKLAINTPKITQESMKIGQQWGMQVSQRLLQRLKEKGYNL